MTLNPEDADRLAKLCGMFGSNHAGERAAAAAKADALVRSLGFAWRDVLISAQESNQQPLQIRAMILFAETYLDMLSEHERDFIETIAAPDYRLSPKQAKWLHDITRKLRAWQQEGRAA